MLIGAIPGNFAACDDDLCRIDKDRVLVSVRPNDATSLCSAKGSGRNVGSTAITHLMPNAMQPYDSLTARNLFGRPNIYESLMEPLSAMINKKLMLPSQKTNYIAVETHYLSQMLKKQIADVFVDERWYISRYPDVVSALTGGDLSTASDHYSMHGYYEHRMPYQILVDEKWYLAEYEDIAVAVRSGTFASGQVHFDELGYREGRIPYPHFRLKHRSDKA